MSTGKNIYKKPLVNAIIKTIIYVYIVLPFLIFAVGWLKPILAVIVGMMTLVGLVLAIKSDKFDYVLVPDERKQWLFLVIAFGIIIIWCILSGIGGFAFQNADQRERNAIFKALIEYNWPVTSQDGECGLDYYIGFWLPASAIGKVLGTKASEFTLIGWTILSIVIVYYLLCIWRKKYSLWPLILLIFFSGMDYLGASSFFKDTAIPFTAHIEWWTKYQYSSMTTQLFWVFNQAVPSWIVTMLLITNKNNRKNILYILSGILICSTFPFVGLVPFVLYYLIKDFSLKNGTLKEIFSIQNIIGVFVIGVISLLYLIGNAASMNQVILSERLITVGVKGCTLAIIAIGICYYYKDIIKKILYNPVGTVLYAVIIFAGGNWLSRKLFGNDFSLSSYFEFYILEFGLYAIWVYRYAYKNFEYYIMIGILIACPFIQIGVAQDFCMRVSIPSLFVLMLFCISYLSNRWKRNKIFASLLIVLLIVGAITPLFEINRSISNTFSGSYEDKLFIADEVPVDVILHGLNFSTNIDTSFFFKYLAKK